MGTAVYGGSPRHNAGRRISVGATSASTMMSGTGIGGGIASHLGHSSPALHQHQQLYGQHSSIQQQLKHPLQQHQKQQQNHQHQSAATMFTVQSAAGSAALLMNHSNSTIIFPPPTSFISAAVPVASASVTATSGIGHQQQQQPTGKHQSQAHYQSHNSLQQQQQPQHQQQQQQQYHHRHSKRKSAVELLAESKPFYVKSETVLDRQHHQLQFYAQRPGGNGAANQQQPSSTMSPSRTQISHHIRNASNVSSGGAGGVGAGVGVGSSVGAGPPLAGYSASASRRSVSSSSDLLQTKLRSLLQQSSLDHGAAGPDVMASPSATAGKVYEHHMHYASPKKLSQELSVLPDPSNSDLTAFFPSAFLSPQSLPPHPAVTDDDIFSYGIDEPLVTDFHTISPPAEYAEDNVAVTHSVASASSRHGYHGHHGHSGSGSNGRGFGSSNRYSGYQRSFSHSPSAGGAMSSCSPNDELTHLHSSAATNTTANGSHTTTTNSAAATNATTTNNTSTSNQSAGFNINSHKSLPDLHAQISRHSPHSEALSCCSRGARSNKSGSSFNRDSGGSSGHYTHRSEPNSSGNAVPVCSGSSAGKYSGRQQSQQRDQQQHMVQQQQHHQQQLLQQGAEQGTGAVGMADFRRDSGSSTQHSGNSYYAYGIPPMRYDCMECRTKAGTQLAAGQHSLPLDDTNCLLNFTTPEVPEAFQDDYQQQHLQQHQQQHHQSHHLQQQQHQNHHQPQQPSTAQMMMMMMVGKPPSSSAAAAAARQSRDKDHRQSHSHPQQQQQQPQHHLPQQHRFAGACSYVDDYVDQPMSMPATAVYMNKPMHQATASEQRLPAMAAVGCDRPPEAELSPPLGTFKRQRCFRVKQRDRYSSPSDRNSRCGDGDESPSDRRPILRSKSDVSDRHWHRNSMQQQQQQQMCASGGVITPPMGIATKLLDSGHMITRVYSSGQPPANMCQPLADGRSEVLVQLERFFDRLGLQEDVYEACIAPRKSTRFGSSAGSSSAGTGGGGGAGGTGGVGRGSRDSDDSDHSSPVFFSDASTVDSTRLPDSSAEPQPILTPQQQQQQAQQQQMYRPSEPPSIVERNARIIKWLCACRKSQLA